MKNINKLYFIFIGFFLLTVSAHAETTALDVVKNSSEQVIEQLKGKTEEFKSDPDAMHELVDKFITPNFDFPKMSRWVLGKKNWRQATSEQKLRFTNAFQKLLIKTYSKALVSSDDLDITYLPIRTSKDNKRVIVSTKIDRHNGSKVIPISYRLFKSAESWKVYDVSIDNVSLVSTYRKTFNDEIKRKSLDELITKLESRAG